MTESRIHRTPPPEGGDDALSAPAPSAAAAQDYAAILADIDDILEENAVAFVQGFVQEGGQ